MVQDKDIIVAIELGSSAIRGIAGQKGLDGNMKILAIEQENIKECVRRGMIFNIDKTTRAIRLIKDHLEEKLNLQIKRAYVGLSGQSLHTVPNKIARDLGQYIKITTSHIDELMDENHNTQYPKRTILETVPQEYTIDGNRTTEPEGIQGSQIEGNFLNIIAKTTLKDNIMKCFKDADLVPVDLFISPIELANHLLPDSEKRSGCVLVDMGAETTTVSIYSDNLLRHLVVIPLGGKNITKDICTICNVGFEEGETLKEKNTLAYDKSQGEGDDKRSVSLTGDRLKPTSELQDIVNARQEEIIRNVWAQIDASTWKDKLLSGIILTGGAATHNGMADAFKAITKFDKVKLARPLMETTVATPGIAPNDDITLNTLIALLLSGTQGCATEKSQTVDINIPEPEPVVAPRDDEEDDEDEEERPRKKKAKKTPWWVKAKNAASTLVNATDEDEDED